MKILVFATDLLPLAGLPTSGTALRTHGLVEGLKANGYDVSVSVPKTALAGFIAHQKEAGVTDLPAETLATLEQYKQHAFDPYNQGQILNRFNPDVVLCGHWPAMALRLKPSQAVIVDLAGPHLLERHFQGAGEHGAATLGKLSVMATADFYIVSGPSQRLYFLSYLLRAAVENPERRIAEITMPLPPTGPGDNRFSCSATPSFSNSCSDEGVSASCNSPHSSTNWPQQRPQFIFGGVFLPWQNPAWGLRSLVNQLEREQHGSLRLIGGPHPNYKINQGQYQALYSELTQSPVVSTSPLLPWDAFTAEMTKADVAINLMEWNLERQMAVTIRSTTYLWAGLPLIYDDYGDLASLIRNYDAGWCVHPGDTAQFEAIVHEILTKPELVRQKSLNALRLSKEVFSWDRAVKPIVDLLGSKHSARLRETDILVDTPENADLSLTPEKPLEQYFITRLGGLTRVEFRLATHGEKITQQLSCELREVKLPAHGVRVQRIKEHETVLVKKESIAVNTLSNNDWATVEFQPQVASAGKTYLLRITSEGSSGKTASAWGARSNPYPMAQLFHGENLLAHTSLCLRTTCAVGSQFTA